MSAPILLAVAARAMKIPLADSSAELARPRPIGGLTAGKTHRTKALMIKPDQRQHPQPNIKNCSSTRSRLCTTNCGTKAKIRTRSPWGWSGSRSNRCETPISAQSEPQVAAPLLAPGLHSQPQQIADPDPRRITSKAQGSAATTCTQAQGHGQRGHVTIPQARPPGTGRDRTPARTKRYALPQTETFISAPGVRFSRQRKAGYKKASTVIGSTIL